jgi:hypothetical protein
MKKIILILFAFVIGLSQLLFQTGCRPPNPCPPTCDLPAPDSLTATPVSSSSVNLDWNLVPTAPNYNVKIYAIDEEGGAPTLVQTQNNVNPTLPINGLTANVLYKAEVRANCENNITSTNYSEVYFRLSGPIMIDDVVMKEKESIMNNMQNSQCNGTSEDYSLGIPIRINWEPIDVYCLDISNATNTSNVKVKIGFKDATTVQYLNISGTNWTSAIVSDHIEIKDASSNQVGKITFNDFSFKLTKLSSFDLKLRSTRY